MKHAKLKSAVKKIVAETRITDIHTHLYPKEFGALSLWGPDELLTYHYLIAEALRHSDISYDDFWSMIRRERADFIWETLFLKNSPISESRRGVLSVFKAFGLDLKTRDLASYRKYFESFGAADYMDRVFSLSGVKEVVMTNDPFDDAERAVWDKNIKIDPRFKAALRIDPLLNSWGESCARLAGWGYKVSADFSGETLSEIRRFLRDWVLRMQPLYMCVSLPPDFKMPDSSPQGRIIEECILPLAREHNLPFAMMIGVKRNVNPSLRLAADSVGKSDIDAVLYLLRKFPQNKFMVTMLSRENSHELCIAARKFRTLLVFGCWWFLNNPSLIEEMTKMRFELLGTSFIPQHSDARVLDQLVYKWAHSREIIGEVLFEKYKDIVNAGWSVSREEIQRDAGLLLGGNLYEFLKMKI